jgi:hypothetical protein
MQIVYRFYHEANIEMEEKPFTSAWNVCSEPSSPPLYFQSVDISFKDDVTVYLLLGVSFMGSATEIENKQGLGVLEKPLWRFFEWKKSTCEGKHSTVLRM